MSGHISRDDLEGLIRNGEIDTVLMVFPDLQGRLVGKRTTGRFFLQSVADAGTENCDYLIACDIDNNPVPGYRFTSYEQGYGDMLAKAVPATPAAPKFKKPRRFRPWPGRKGAGAQQAQVGVIS